MDTFVFKHVGRPVRLRRRGFLPLSRSAVAAVVASATSLALAGQAFAATGQGAGGVAGAPSGGIGSQIVLMAGEGSTAGGTAFSTFCYLAAVACFFFGGWALWQSRQPQNRESGYVPRAMVGLFVCGLFVSAGAWINKASVSASGGAATITGQPSMITFGAGTTTG